jgi:hypothetical protein
MVFNLIVRQDGIDRSSNTANLERVRFDELNQICFWDVAPLP